MRPTSRRARRPGHALACLLVALPLLASHLASAEPANRRRPVNTCTRFDQVDREDDAVDFTIDNRCDVALQCRLSWRLTCAPDSKRPRRSRQSATLQVATATSETRTASAATCGGEGWALDSVVWSCAPARD